MRRAGRDDGAYPANPPEPVLVSCQACAAGDETAEPYDALILSPGAEPMRPPIPGADSPGVFTLRNLHDMDAIIDQIAAKNPSDVDGYRAFLDFAENVFHEGYTKLAATPFLNFWSMIQVSPQLIRLQSYRSVYSIISKFIKDDHLRQVFSFHPLLVFCNASATTEIYTLIHYLERNWGVFFVKGGTGALVAALVKLFPLALVPALRPAADLVSGQRASGVV